MFRYESVNSTRKFTIVAEIVSLLKKIYKRDAPFRAVFKVKTLAVYPREVKHIPRNLNLPPFCLCLFLWKWCNPFPRARARFKHAHSFDRCGGIVRVVRINLVPRVFDLLDQRSQNESSGNQSRSQSPRAFWSVPGHGALE